MKKIIVGFRTFDEALVRFLLAAPRHILVNTVSLDVCLSLRASGINCACSRVSFDRMFIEHDDIIIVRLGEINPLTATNCPGVIVMDPEDFAAVAAELCSSPTNELSIETRQRLRNKLIIALQAPA